ncbi:MAG: ABC transporter permease [Candidatus Micrarchaeaceae archaeon]
MGLFSDIYTIFIREMFVFKNNLRSNILRALAFPIVIILLFGNISASTFESHVLVVNYAQNPQSYAFINDLVQTQTLLISNITSENAAINQLHNSQTSAVIVILPGFPYVNNGNPTVDIYYSATGFSAVGAVLNTVQSSVSQVGGKTSLAEQAFTTSQPVQNSPVSNIELYGANSNYKSFLIAGVIGLVAAFGALFGGGISLINDRETGTLKSFLIAPISKNAIIMGKIIAGTLQSLLYGILALIIGLLDGAGIAMGSMGILLILLIIVVVSIGFSGVATLMASRIKKIEAYTIFGFLVGLALWFMSGALLPATAFPGYLETLSNINPLTYAVSALRDIMLVGYISVSSAILDFSVLVAFLAIGIILSFIMFKRNLN